MEFNKQTMKHEMAIAVYNHLAETYGVEELIFQNTTIESIERDFICIDNINESHEDYIYLSYEGSHYTPVVEAVIIRCEYDYDQDLLGIAEYKQAGDSKGFENFMLGE